MTDRRPKTRPTGMPPSGAKKSAPQPPESTPVVRGTWLGVKTAYTLERRNWETLKTGKPSGYRPAATYDGAGPKTIEGVAVVEKPKANRWQLFERWCAANKVDASEFIRYVFRHLPPSTDNPPEPFQLGTPTNLARWRKGKPAMEEEFRQSLDRQSKVAKREITVHQAVHEETYEDACLLTVGSSHLSLTPLFRFCLATNVGTPRLRSVAGSYESRAIMELQRFRRLYMKTWAAVLPKGFAARADRLYPHLLARIGFDAGEPEET